MIERKNVHGAVEQAVPIMVNIDTVYERTNIRIEEVDNVMGMTYTVAVYDEVQYTKDEYLQKMAEEKRTSDEVLADLIQLLVDKGVIL